MANKTFEPLALLSFAGLLRQQEVLLPIPCSRRAGTKLYSYGDRSVGRKFISIGETLNTVWQ